MTAVSLLILVAATWIAVRAMVSPAFRMVVPRMVLKLAVLLLAYAIFLLGLALFAGKWLAPMAVLALCVVAAERWRARAGYGVARGLPPGSLAPIDPGPFSDRDYYIKAAERYGPVFKMREITRRTVCVMGLERGLALLQQYDDKGLQFPRFGFERLIPGGYLGAHDGERHAILRQQLKWMFAPEVMSEHAPRMESVFREELHRAALSSGRLRLQLNRMVWAAWLPMFFGMGPDSKMAAQIKALFKVIDIRNPQCASAGKVSRGVQALEDLLREHVRRIRERKSPVGVRSFLSQLLEKYPESAEDSVVLRNLIYLLHSSWSDVVGILTWLTKMLSDHPSWRGRLREEIDAAGAGVPRLLDRVIMETFRLEQMEVLLRQAVENIPFENFVIPKGWCVRVCVRESHRVSDVFENPSAFNPDRFAGDRAYAPHEFLPFGTGAHGCIGVPITLTVGRAWLRALVAGFDWEVAEDGPLEFGPYRHWRPHSRFRIRLVPRS